MDGLAQTVTMTVERLDELERQTDRLEVLGRRVEAKADIILRRLAARG